MCIIGHTLLLYSNVHHAHTSSSSRCARSLIDCQVPNKALPTTTPFLEIAPLRSVGFCTNSVLEKAIINGNYHIYRLQYEVLGIRFGRVSQQVKKGESQSSSNNNIVFGATAVGENRILKGRGDGRHFSVHSFFI